MKVNTDLNKVMRFGAGVLNRQRRNGSITYSAFVLAVIAVGVIPFFVVLWVAR